MEDGVGRCIFRTSAGLCLIVSRSLVIMELSSFHIKPNNPGSLKVQPGKCRSRCRYLCLTSYSEDSPISFPLKGDPTLLDYCIQEEKLLEVRRPQGPPT